GDGAGQPRQAAAHPDDDDRDYRRHAADRLRPGRRRRFARIDGRDDHRRPGTLPAADTAHHAGRLLLLRRSARVVAGRDTAEAAGEEPATETCRDLKLSVLGATG